MVLVIRQLVSFSINIFPPPSVHWLRDLLDGVVKPWEQPSRPPRAHDLERLREWLQRNLSEEVWPWKQLAGTTPFYDDTLSKKHQMKYAGKTVKVATWVLLTRELFAEKAPASVVQGPCHAEMEQRFTFRHTWHCRVRGAVGNGNLKIIDVSDKEKDETKCNATSFLS